MENMTMTPVTYWHGDLAFAGCATSAIALRTSAVQGVDVRDAAIDRTATVAAAAKAAVVAAERKRGFADATATGHAGLIAGVRPGSPAWSPPL